MKILWQEIFHSCNMKEFVWYLNINPHSVVMYLIFPLGTTYKKMTAFFSGTSLEILTCNKFLTFLLLSLDSVFVVRIVRPLFVCSICSWSLNLLYISWKTLREWRYQRLHMFNLRRWHSDDERIALETCRWI